MSNYIVKRGGHTEVFDERKLYASVYSSALALREPSATAELIAQEVTRDVKAWLANKHEVTSNDLRRKAVESLEVLHRDAAYIYKHQRNLG